MYVFDLLSCACLCVHIYACVSFMCRTCCSRQALWKCFFFFFLQQSFRKYLLHFSPLVSQKWRWIRKEWNERIICDSVVRWRKATVITRITPRKHVGQEDFQFYLLKENLPLGDLECQTLCAYARCPVWKISFCLSLWQSHYIDECWRVWLIAC